MKGSKATRMIGASTTSAVYVRYFPNDLPAQIFVNVPAWPGYFDIEIDCIATV
jgi:2-iminobutanoate/2-iminopropanoate deaminase